MSDSQKKAESIRLLILDVDGVLTNGIIYYGTNGIELKGFHIHDGMGIKLLQKAGIDVAIISGKNSEPVVRRLQDLNIKHVYLGHTDKLPIYEALKQKLGLTDNEIAYVGDDLPDLPVLRRTGLSISVPDAPATITKHVDFITKNSGGAGAVREVCEFILNAQNKYESVIESYLL